MRTLKLTIAYDGTRYAGWQVQEIKNKATIQGALEQALRRILQEHVKVIGSGRTDAGVHAEGQVAHVRTRSAMPAERLLRSVNQLLPSDIAVTRIEEAGASFHARFSAARKRYCYRLFTGPVVPPFIRPYVHQVQVPLDLARMRREAEALKGRHDFRAFAKRRPGARSTTRAVTEVSLRRCGRELRFEVEGDGFLHTMVRSIAGTLIDIGRGRLAPGTVRRMLRTGDRRLAGATAPAKGLSLVEVRYPGERG